MLSIFIYLRSFTQENVTENGAILEFYQKIKENYLDSNFCICLTKYDLFLKEYLEGSKFYNPNKNPEDKERNRDAYKSIENFKGYLQDIKDLYNYVNISKIFILDNKNVSNEKPSKQINHFIEYINILKNECKSKITHFFYHSNEE